MRTENDLHVVLGASGGTGNAIVRHLADRGHRVRAVSRTGGAGLPDGVEAVAADIMDPEQARRACDGAAVAYHAAQPSYTSWVQEFPAMNSSVAQGAAAASAKLVFADNLYMYAQSTDPLTEDSPLSVTGKKGPLRARMAEELLAAHRAGTLRVAIGRSSDYYGPNGLNSVLGERLFGAAVKGKKALWLGSLDVPRSLSYLEDMARAFVILGERPEAEGQVWHLPTADPISGQQFLELVFAELGLPQKIARLSPGTARVAGVFVPMIRELRELMYQWTAPFVLDASKFQRSFGPFQPTPHPEAVKRTVAWLREHVG
jgi:nucleoside-diphosphate-sugar epimerase